METHVIRSTKHGLEVWLLWVWIPERGITQRQFWSEAKARQVEASFLQAYQQRLRQLKVNS